MSGSLLAKIQTQKTSPWRSLYSLVAMNDPKPFMQQMAEASRFDAHVQEEEDKKRRSTTQVGPSINHSFDNDLFPPPSKCGLQR